MKTIETIEESMCSIIRNMEVKDKLMVPLKNWALARNYVKEIQKDFGVKFKVARMQTLRTKLDFILIQRLE